MYKGSMGSLSTYFCYLGKRCLALFLQEVNIFRRQVLRQFDKEIPWTTRLIEKYSIFIALKNEIITYIGFGQTQKQIVLNITQVG